jgi:integrase
MRVARKIEGVGSGRTDEMSKHHLTNRFVNTVTEAGMYGDGDGLYLQVGEAGNAKSWIFRYSRGRFGKPGKTEMGLGPVHTFSLNEARDLAEQCRKQLLKGIDPRQARDAERIAKRLEDSKGVTFRECATEWVEFMANERRKAWASQTAKNNRGRIKKHLAPLMDMPISMIDVDQCFRTLEPIVKRTLVMAIHVHMYLKGILDRAKARNLRSGDNPADLTGPLGALLPDLRGDTRDVEHHPGLAPEKIGAFMAQLRTSREAGTAALTMREAAEMIGLDRTKLIHNIHDGKLKAFKKPGTEGLKTVNSPWFVWPVELRKAGYLLDENKMPDRRPFIPLEAYLIQFQILTAARPSEARMMRWDEAPDFEKTGLWIIPAHRHKLGKKTNKPIYKPLSPPAIAILETMKAAQQADGAAHDFVFAYGNAARLSKSFGRPMSDTTERSYLAQYFDPNEASLHGFRTTFSSWANEQRGFESKDIERLLGHIAGEGETEVARIYNRFTKRLEPMGQLMDAWAVFCGRTEPLPADIIPFRQAKGDSHE